MGLASLESPESQEHLRSTRPGTQLGVTRPKPWPRHGLLLLLRLLLLVALVLVLLHLLLPESTESLLGWAQPVTTALEPLESLGLTLGPATEPSILMRSCLC